MGNVIGGQVSRVPTLEEERERLTPLIKDFRKQIDALIQQIPHGFGQPILCRVFNEPVQQSQAEVRRKLIEAKMWCGKTLEYLGNPFPKELADKAE